MIKPGEVFYRVVEDPAQRKASPPDQDPAADTEGGDAREPD
jgi:hypothetical protein